MDAAVAAPVGELALQMTTTPDLSERGELRGHRVAMLDVTEQRRTERQAQGEKEALAGNCGAGEVADLENHLKDRFLGIALHELRTPLNAMLGWTHILARRPGDDNPFYAG